MSIDRRCSLSASTNRLVPYFNNLSVNERLRMRTIIPVVCLVCVSICQVSLAQAPAEVWFENTTEVPLTIRCFSKRLDLAGFSEQVNPGETVGTTNLASGDRVIGVWASDQVTSVARRFRPGSVSTVMPIMIEGTLRIQPPTVQAPIGQPEDRSRSHFNSRQWQTLCQASDGRNYPVSIDFKMGTYTTQSYIGRFSNMSIWESKEKWKISGRWASPTQAGNVSFTVLKANLNYLSGSYTIDGNATGYQWNSK